MPFVLLLLCTQIDVRTHECANAHARMHVCTHAHLHTHTHTHISLHVCTNKRALIYTNMHVIAIHTLYFPYTTVMTSYRMKDQGV